MASIRLLFDLPTGAGHQITVVMRPDDLLKNAFLKVAILLSAAPDTCLFADAEGIILDGAETPQQLGWHDGTLIMVQL